jgi:hypothetical protein
MRRRRLLGLLSSAGALSLAGCSGVFGNRDDESEEDRPVDPKPTQKAPPSTDRDTTPPPDRPAAELPDECPVSTIPGYGPPAEPTRKAVESFIRKYEEAYMLKEQFLSYEDELTEAILVSADQVEYGYAIEAEVGSVDVILEASIHARPAQVEFEPAALSALDSQALVAAARRAVDEQQEIVERLPRPQGETKADTLPQRLREQIEALPGDENGGYVAIDGTAVRLWVEVQEVHADYFTYSVLYYVDSRVVRRQYLPGADAVAQDGKLVECRADRN